MAVTAPVGLIVAGFVEQRIGSKKRIVLLFGAGVAAMFFLLAGFGLHSFWVSMLCFMGVMFFQGYYVMVQTQVRDIFPLHMVGRANTVINTFGVIGVFVMQWATGFIVRLFPGADAIASETAYRLIFAFIGISVFIGLWCYRNVADTVVNPTQP